MNEVARVYGNGATYDAVEGQLRKAKKLAKELQAEANGRSCPAKAASRASNMSLAKSCTSFLLIDFLRILTGYEAVKGARVSKTKKAATVKIKPKVLKETSYGTNEEENEV